MYILTLQLKTEKYQKDILHKRLEISRNIYNSTLNIALKRYKLILESKQYRKIKRELKNINKKYHQQKTKELNNIRKELYKELNNIYKEYGLTQYSLYEIVKPMYKYFKDNIGSLEAQAIADRVWIALDKMLNGNGKKVHFKKYGQVNSIENKWNRSGLKYDENKNIIKWGKLNLPIIIKNNDVYALEALQGNIKYVRIIRKLVRGKYKFYVQFILDGIPPIKINKETGEIKRSLGIGNVGLDIGTQTIAISSNSNVNLLELCPEVDNIEKEKRKLLRKLDRQRRSNNPDNYNKNGTIKNGIRINGKLSKLKWNKSKKYIKTQNKLRELYRKQADIRKLSHEKLANYIISLGNKIYVEDMNYKGLQIRNKETTINKETGKYNCKKRFGTSLANKAPAMLLEIINRKLKWQDEQLYKIDTYKVKASQYNHIKDKYIKKELSERWNDFGEFKIQRDLYSAFLIMSVKDNLKEIDRDLCFKEFDNFKILHDKEVERIKISDNKLISSMGI